MHTTCKSVYSTTICNHEKYTIIFILASTTENELHLSHAYQTFDFNHSREKTDVLLHLLIFIVITKSWVFSSTAFQVINLAIWELLPWLLC